MPPIACWRKKSRPGKNSTRPERQASLYFQGYFFRKPEIVATTDIPSNKLNYLRMLQAVQEPELDLRKIEKLIKGEVVHLLPPASLSEFGGIRASATKFALSVTL